MVFRESASIDKLSMLSDDDENIDDLLKSSDDKRDADDGLY